MKRKIFSILFALMLVLSLSLVTAVPAGANGDGANVTLTLPENVYRPAEFTVSSTTTNSGTEYSNVRFDITLDGPEDFTGDRADTFTITKVNGSTETQGINDTFTLVDGDWIGYWGPAEGFTLSDPYDVTSTFTVQMCDTGTAPLGNYNLNVELVDLFPDPDVILDTVNDSFMLSDDTLYVGTTEYEYQFTTIQDSVDASTAGDTISVAEGTYEPFTVDGKTGLTIQSSSVVTVQGVQSVTTAYTDRDCVVFVKDSMDIVLDDLNIQGQDLGTINTKNYGVIYENSSGEIKDCTVSPNTIGNLSSMAIGIWDGSNVTVDTCTIENFGRVGVFIYNGCTVDIIGGSIEGQVYSGEGEVCYGIEVEGAYNDATPGTASLVSINGVEIYNCDNTFATGPTWDSGGVYINGWLEYYNEDDSTVEITNCDIHNNYIGIIVVKSSLSSAHFNNIYDNRDCGVDSIAAHDASTAVFDAALNWWGDISGPRHDAPFDTFPANPGGLGDAVSDNVNYIPWLTRDFQTVLDDNIAYFGIPMVYLNTGWNTFSTPIALEPDYDTWGEYIELGDGLARYPGATTYYFDGENQVYGQVLGSYRLNPCDAIYVRMLEPDIAAILLSPEFSPVASKELYAGWNLVSLAWLPEGPDDGCLALDRALATVYTVTGDLTGWSLVVNPPVNWWWGPAWPSFLRAQWSGVFEDSPPMCITQGYWVFMINDGTLAGFTSTPIPLEMPH